MGTRFSEAYSEVLDGLASKKLSKDDKWQAIIVRARKFAAIDGFNVGEASVVNELRAKLSVAAVKGTNEAVSLLEAAGEDLSGKGAGVMIDADLARRLGAFKTLRHTYLLKRFGAHKVWCVSIPPAFTDWPHEALKGGLAGATTKLADTTERFSLEQRKNLSDASAEGMKWVQRAMTVCSNVKKDTNFAKVARWFADASSTDADVVAAAATLNAGLKKIAAKLMSGHLIYTDSVSERGGTDNDGVEAFVWGDPLDVVYIEEEFFGARNTLTGLTNWARIVVHELTHRELDTEDHAYEHQGINPRKLTASKAIENADSWAWFCADCGGALTDALIKNAMAR
ncbi:M35 family metallo-endopeptidase [Viridibacterium curvum]|uniref:Lysine-specific metallo-endopeptidase domain-containing protein n=1 Tax=Viridibacterium curvum TaxID=1101404 RepID=A0ABP9QUM9_9RHOO